jgi:HK97 family phage portal protein
MTPEATRSRPGFFTRLGRGIASAARRAHGLIPGQYYGYSLIAPVLSGIIVTPRTALTLTAFFCGVDTISTDIAKLPLVLTRKIRGGGRKRALTDPRYALLRSKPNEENNAFRYRQMVMGHALGWGNHYSEIVRDGSGFPTALWPLDPSTTRPQRDKDTQKLYYTDLNTGKKWQPEHILHIAGLSFDGLLGYSVTTMGRQAIGLGIAEEQFGAALFGNGARPGGILKHPKRLTQDGAKRLRESWENVHAGTLNAHRTAVLEEGMEWVEAQISPEAAQFLTSRQFQVIEICRLLKIPPHKLQDYSQAHLANVEESNIDYVTSTLQGWCEAIEAECNRKLLFDEEQGRLEFVHDMNALLRGNSTARSTYYRNLFSVAAITPNEIRESEGLNPFDDAHADQSYLQAQYVPLERAGEAMAAQGPGPAAPGQPTSPEDDGAGSTDQLGAAKNGKTNGELLEIGAES